MRRRVLRRRTAPARVFWKKQGMLWQGLQMFWKKQGAWQRLLMLSPALVLVCVLLIILQADGSTPAEGAAADKESSIHVRIDTQEDWRLKLVNQANTLQEGFEPNLRQVDGIDEYFDNRAAGSLEEMLTAARSEGLNPIICSAYRSVERQAELYYEQKDRYMAMGYTKTEAETEAAKSVAPPGASEHSLGLAADIVSAEYQLLTEEQKDTPENSWLRENCWRYGFVVRYPEGKQDITGIIYEPWHFRYVGEEYAKDMTEREMCLEEYADWLRG